MTEENPGAENGLTVFIAGPTASGKSDAALMLARATGGEIVNADALQVYRDLAILSARPGEAALAAAHHHLFGHVDGARRYSVGAWLGDAAKAISAIQARGRIAIVAGGTGLYFTALEHGLSEMPAITPQARAAARARLDEIGMAAFRAEVAAADPAMARLEANDRQRHLRAYEVLLATGRPLSHWQSGRSGQVAHAAARVAIEPPRDALYAAIDARFDAMLGQGAMEEAATIAARGLDPELPVMKAVGVRELIGVLEGRASLDAARRAAQQASRNFAKRQLTWLRNQCADWPRAADPAGAAESLFLALSRRDGA